MRVQSLGREEPLEEEMAISRQGIRAWKISWTEEPRGLLSMIMVAKSNQTQLSMHAHKVSSSVSREEEINTDLLWACALQHDCYGLNLTPQNSYIEALTLSSSECICIWRQGL